MKEFEKKIKFFASRIRLTDEESENIKSDILRRVFARSAMQTFSPKISPFSYFMKFVPNVLILLFILSGGVSYAARNTLPGDFLYPFKIGVTEKVQGFLLVSTKEQAKFEIILVERRAEEAIKLVKTGKMDDKKNASINDSIEKHTASIKQKVEELKVEDKIAAKEVVGTLAVSLAEQGEKIAQATNNESVPSLGLTEKIQEQAKQAQEVKTILDAEVLLDTKNPFLPENNGEKIDDLVDFDFFDESFSDDFEKIQTSSTQLNQLNQTIIPTKSIKGVSESSVLIQELKSVPESEIKIETKF